MCATQQAPRQQYSSAGAAHGMSHSSCTPVRVRIFHVLRRRQRFLPLITRDVYTATFVSGILLFDRSGSALRDPARDFR